ncbi:toxin-antitoxin system YwqK family antitoxin [Marinilabiliaceae bacterium JC017]|nr:toxin-antitoxin system YwqK family antitoxin [Marinilabiliaceae bacterium JC017]
MRKAPVGFKLGKQLSITLCFFYLHHPYFKMMPEKNLIQYFLTITLILSSSSIMAQSYCLFQGDTINRIDQQGNKQGLWILFSDKDSIIVEKGHYKDGKKNGIWTALFANGKTKHQITFAKGQAIGAAKFYYETGYIKETGLWNKNHWEGSYQYYFPNGQLAYDWFYNPSGKRTGPQKYFHENGQLKFKGEWIKGQAIGTVEMFNKKGQLIAKRNYQEGKCANVETIASINSSLPEPDLKSPSIFTGTGNHTVYNLNGTIEKKGYFEKGNLKNGELFIYNDEGKLILKHIYKNGQLTKSIKPE